MQGRTLAVIIATLCSVFADAATAGVLVAFREKAAVEKSLVTLGDIADVHGAKADEVQRLSSVILGPAPAMGRDLSIPFETIRSRLLSAGVDLARLEFSGPTTVTITGPASAPRPPETPASARSAPVARSQLEKTVTQAIRKHLAMQSRGGSFEVSASMPEEAANLLASAETRGVEVTGGHAPWTGEQVFVLRVLDAAEHVREVRIACVVSARPNVLAAKLALPRGHVIGPDDLMWKKAESDADAACITDPSELLGRETQTALRTGQVIDRASVKTLPLVRTGQFVTVSSRRPGLAVQRVMKAKGDGAFGEIVAMQTLEDHKTILARITGLLEGDVVEADNASGTKPPHGEIAAQMITPVGYEAAANLTSMPSPTFTPRVHVNPTEPLSVPASTGGDGG